jgi:cytochrome P450
MLEHFGAPRAQWLEALKSVPAGLDVDGYFRRRAGRSDQFAVMVPGLGPVHFVATVAGARDILRTPGALLCAPTPNPIEPVVGPDSVILTSGERHRRTRRLLMPAFQAARMPERAEALARAVADETDTWRIGERIPLHSTAQSITLRIIVRAVLGVEEGPRFDEYTRVVTALMNANTAPLMLLPWLRKDFAGRGPWARLMRLRTQFDILLATDIERKRRCPVTGRGDVLSLLLPESDEDGRGLDDDDLHQQVRTLVVAGHDTTASALAWALYHIHQAPGVRQRIVDELSSAPATPHTMAKLPYLSAVVSETLRMHPTVPIVLRKLTSPLTIDGVQRGAGDIVGIAVPALHFDPAIWDDPQRFRPDRFLSPSPTPFEYLPFGGGYRRCIGAAFATYELAVAIGTIMSSVALRMPRRESHKPPPRSVPRGIAAAPRREVQLEVTGRI